MTPISETLHELLVRQGMSAGPGATSRAHGMKDEGRSHMGAHPQVMGDAAGGTPHRPTAGEEKAQPMRNSGKRTGAATTPANKQGQSFDPSSAVRGPVLFLVASNKCLNVASPSRMPRAATFRHLQLVSSR